MNKAPTPSEQAADWRSWAERHGLQDMCDCDAKAAFEDAATLRVQQQPEDCKQVAKEMAARDQLWTTQEDVELNLLMFSARIAQQQPCGCCQPLRDALERLLKHAGIADQHFADVDAEDHLAESRARTLLRQPRQQPASVVTKEKIGNILETFAATVARKGNDPDRTKQYTGFILNAIQQPDSVGSGEHVISGLLASLVEYMQLSGSTHAEIDRFPIVQKARNALKAQPRQQPEWETFGPNISIPPQQPASGGSEEWTTQDVRDLIWGSTEDLDPDDLSRIQDAHNAALRRQSAPTEKWPDAVFVVVTWLISRLIEAKPELKDESMRLFEKLEKAYQPEFAPVEQLWPIMAEFVQDKAVPIERRSYYSNQMKSAGLNPPAEVESTPVEQVMDLNQIAWDAIKSAAAQSSWIPRDYMMNDWVSDVCRFLTESESAPVEITPKCETCDWTNVGCLNVGDPGKPKWICPGCIKRALDAPVEAWLDCDYLHPDAVNRLAGRGPAVFWQHRVTQGEQKNNE